MTNLLHILQSLIAPFIIVTASVFLFIILAKFEKVKLLFHNNRFLILFLLAWSLIGFFTREDFSERCGCLVSERVLFSLDYILFSLISLSVFTISLFLRSDKAITLLLVFELLYWLLKLLFIKSGYVGGLGIHVFSIYDFVGLTLRLLLLNNLNGRKLKSISVLLIAGLIITFKFLVLPCQENFVYRDLIKPIVDKKLLVQLDGTWEGECSYFIDTSIYKTSDTSEYDIVLHPFDTSEFKDSTIIKINDGVQLSFLDSLLIIHSGIPGYSGCYRVEYIQARSRSLAYLPSRIKKSEHDMYDTLWNYMLPVSIEELSSCEMIIHIKEFKLTLQKNQ